MTVAKGENGATVMARGCEVTVGQQVSVVGASVMGFLLSEHDDGGRLLNCGDVQTEVETGSDFRNGVGR